MVAIIPARNEADVIGRAVSSLLEQENVELRIILIDDESEDGTAEAALAAAEALGARSRMSLLRSSPIPEGWTGKLWAMEQGWEAARPMVERGECDSLLLTDADIEHGAGCLSRLAAVMERGHDMASLMVRLECRTLPERLLVPAFVYFFFLLYPPRRVANAGSRTAGAAGGCILISPRALQASGGFETIRGEIIDDCNLARKVKQSGGRLWLGTTAESRSLRGHGGWGGMTNMIARTAFNQLGHSTLLLLGCVLGMLATFIAPVALLFAPSLMVKGLAAAALTLMFASYLSIIRLYAQPAMLAVTLPLAALFYLWATVLSALRYWRGRGGEWKGRAQDAG